MSIKMDAHFFSWVDYTIFVIITSISCGIGLYFGLYTKQETTNDYLFGGKNMNWLPVSISLASCGLSGQSILGLATEIYLHGSQISLMFVSNVIASFVNYYLFLPVFYNLQLISVFQYLELRFNKLVKTFVTFLVATTTIMLLPLYMYSPSLAFSQVTGVNISIIAPIMTFLCVSYTSLGGIKAVVWADGLQLIITVFTIVTVIVLGIISIGGVNVLVHRATEGQRLTFFDFNLDPTARITFWSMTFGFTASWCTAVCISPAEVQRTLSLPRSSIKKFLIMFTIVLSLIKLMCMLMGLVIYGKYYDCDPKSIGIIKKADQVVPYFIAELTYYIPGFNGLFIAAFFGSALSTFSTILNTMSGVIYNDIAPWFIPKQTLHTNAGLSMKIIVVLLGIISSGLMYILEKMGTVFEIFYYLRGITAGTFLGVFTLGLFIPFANTKGVLGGGITSLILMSIIIINNQIYVWNGSIQNDTKPLQTYGCPSNATILNTTTITTKNYITEQPFWLFRVSFQYYDLIGAVTTLLIGIFISWLAKSTSDPSVNDKCLSPVVRKFINKYEVNDNGNEMKPLKTLQRE